MQSMCAHAPHTPQIWAHRPTCIPVPWRALGRGQKHGWLERSCLLVTVNLCPCSWKTQVCVFMKRVWCGTLAGFTSNVDSLLSFNTPTKVSLSRLGDICCRWGIRTSKVTIGKGSVRPLGSISGDFIAHQAKQPPCVQSHLALLHT